MAADEDVLKPGSKKEGYDPIQRAEDVARIVCEGDRRKYHRFRPARFYGGIATADCVGCPLRCLFCWSWVQVVSPHSHGNLFSPQDVAANLVGIARKKRFRQIRISGNEPTLGREHLLKVLERIPPDIVFILETNGLLLGYDSTYAQDLARFGNLHVRVSLKGTNEEEFSTLTGATPDGFSLQLQGLKNLSRAGVKTHAAVMVSFSPPQNIGALQERLKAIDPAFEDIEIEELVLYGSVEQRLTKSGLFHKTAHASGRIPPEQI
jgi:uncharacterized Fe-S cluster-containing radical SAM superfamily protein